MTTGKTITLTRRTFVGKVMSLLLNMLSMLVITFLPRSTRLLISWLQSPSAVILEPRKRNNKRDHLCSTGGLSPTPAGGGAEPSMGPRSPRGHCRCVVQTSNLASTTPVKCGRPPQSPSRQHPGTLGREVPATPDPHEIRKHSSSLQFETWSL